MPITLKFPESAQLAAMVVHSRALLLRSGDPAAIRACYGVAGRTGLPTDLDALEEALSSEHVVDFSDDETLESLRAHLEEHVRQDPAFAKLYGSDPVFLHALAVARGAARRRGAPRDLPAILLQGASGSGKELLARAIHEASGLDGKFVPVHCAGMTLDLLEDALFGHTKGAFSQAVQRRKGLVASAEGGTLFIDEVADLPPQAQVALLRFLNDQYYRPVGEDKEERANVRIVSATWRDLDDLVAEGRFREDLLHRLAGVRISLPSLDDRRHELLRLAEQIAREHGVAAEPTFDPEAALAIQTTSWAGGLRQLAIEIREAVRCSEGSTVRLEHLAPDRVVRFHRNTPGIRAAAQCLAWSPGGRAPTDDEVRHRLGLQLAKLDDVRDAPLTGQLKFVSRVQDAFASDSSTHELLETLIGHERARHRDRALLGTLSDLARFMPPVAHELAAERIREVEARAAQRDAQTLALADQAAARVPGLLQLMQFVYMLPGLSEAKRDELFDSLARVIAAFTQLLPGFVSHGVRRIFGSPLDQLFVEVVEEPDPNNPFLTREADPALRSEGEWRWLATHAASMAEAVRLSGYAKNTVAKYFRAHTLTVNRDGAEADDPS